MCIAVFIFFRSHFKNDQLIWTVNNLLSECFGAAFSNEKKIKKQTRRKLKLVFGVAKKNICNFFFYEKQSITLQQQLSITLQLQFNEKFSPQLSKNGDL